MTALPSLSAAEQLRDHLVAELGTKWTWTACPDTPANVTRGKRWGAVWRTHLEPSGGRLATALTLQVYAAKAAVSEATEHELDDVLDAVMLALQKVPGLRFQKATRVVFAEAFAGWEIETTKEHNNYYAETVRREGEAS